MTTEVAPGAIAHSADLFSAARDQAFKAADQALAVLQGLAGMGGTDRSGHKWRTDYDNYVGGESPGQGLTNSMQASVNSLGRVSELLHATAVNHNNANTQSQIGPKPPPQEAPAAASDICLAVLPSAEGGGAGEPAWWSTIVSYLQGWTWPNGHQDQLRRASDAWREAGRGFRDAKRGLEGDAHSLGAIAPLMDQRSPEMNAVVATCNKAANSLSTIADGCDVAADMCAAYAKAIDEAHSKVEHEMVVLGATVVVTEVVAAILVPLTLGASEAVSKGIDVARITATAQRIIEILRAFAAAAEVSALPAVAGAANAARVLGPELAEILSSRATIFGIEGVGAGGRAVDRGAAKWLELAGGRQGLEGWKPYGNLTEEQFVAKWGSRENRRYPGENYAMPGTQHEARLAPGSVIDRYGRPDGAWLSPEGTPFAGRGLPPESASMPHTAYRVGNGPLPPGYRIEESRVAPWFEQPGGGVQYRVTGPNGKDAPSLDPLIRSGFLVPAG
ncbi:TNT domain-containing protein [Mycobacteroides salmoniphilum]|uniref:DUF4237 domain-containing protein n=1 Tax=Mycobacteroides salmoniphilum TaxID=404941 RepID=A0A4R8SDN7_9MYCO|nr:TNT domain-containing protein [Mycobacteroides salmoniphilum]TDZ93539.1 hypothetical protein CCUG60885_03142 [Mycobacteroides salmoniphilum]TEA09322.1 hypothetical protein CCUG60883_00083 [Mycobacteroides salmoniphilum]